MGLDFTHPVCGPRRRFTAKVTSERQQPNQANNNSERTHCPQTPACIQPSRPNTSMTTTNILSKTISAAATLILCGVAAQAATLKNGTTGDGELFVGLRATGGQGATKNVVIDLGSAAGLAALPAGSVVSLGHIGADLAGTYGGTWFERPDLLWSAVSGNTGTAPGVAQDVGANTLYGGVQSSSPGVFPLTTTAYNRAATNAQSTVVTIIDSMADRKSTRLNSSHHAISRMPSSA